MKKPAAAPSIIRIVGKNYCAMFVDSVDSNDSNGEHDMQKQEIKVKNSIHPELQRDTLLHEILHAIDEQLDMRLKHRQVHALAVAIMQVLRENDDLVGFLTASVKESGRK